MEKKINKRPPPPNANQHQIEELKDRHHERNWVGGIILFALGASLVMYLLRGEKDFALSILNIASVGLGYFVSHHTKS